MSKLINRDKIIKIWYKPSEVALITGISINHIRLLINKKILKVRYGAGRIKRIKIYYKDLNLLHVK